MNTNIRYNKEQKQWWINRYKECESQNPNDSKHQIWQTLKIKENGPSKSALFNWIKGGKPKVRIRKQEVKEVKEVKQEPIKVMKYIDEPNYRKQLQLASVMIDMIINTLKTLKTLKDNNL